MERKGSNMAEGSKNSSELKILVIEKDAQIRRQILGFLSEARSPYYKMIEAGDLKTSFEAASEHMFDVVLLDLNLPDSSGTNTLQKLRPQFGMTPFVIINCTDASLSSVLLNSGASDYLTPSEMQKDTLMKVIHKAHERSKWRGEGSPLHEDLKAAKIGAVRDATQNMVDDLNPSVEEIHSKVESLRSELYQVVNEQSKLLLNSTEQSAKSLKHIVEDFVGFAKDLSTQVPVEDHQSSRYRILVVEDEPQVSDIILRRLSRLNETKVDTAANGIDAYNLCVKSSREGTPYHIIISDWKMPKMTGFELLSKLRRHPIYRKVPFMMISAVDDRESIREAISLKVSHYLIKPFTKEDFDKHFKRLLYHVY